VTNLAELKNDWEHLAERDALWAILTDNRKVGGKWELDEFMATGVAEIDTVLRHLKRIRQVPDPNGAVLDFGCGVGRLTQALAAHFASCVGVDISEQMIQKAEALNRHPHCRYVVNTDEQLPFADATFAFIYSNIVLQHVPPRFAEGYLREFVRVLAPGGVLVFGVQDSCAGVSSVMVRVRQIVRLRSRIKSVLGVSAGNMQMNCLPESSVRLAIGSAKVVDVQFTNSAAKDFNGRLDYLPQPPTSGYIGKQYCVVKER
jgi:SAM-dependent methyltransferase